MTQTIHNPVRWSDIRREMTPAEHFFACCLSRGLPCELGNAVPQKSTPHNTIRAEVIRFFAFCGNDDHQVLGARIRLTGAWICGKKPLHLMHVDIPYALHFHYCYFADAIVNVQYATCEALYLKGSYMERGLMADGLKTKESVLLNDGFTAKGEVALSRARIGGDLSCTGGKFNNPSGRALMANQTTVRGGMFLREPFSAKGEVRLLSARIDGDLDCMGGKFSHPNGYALSADGMTVGGNIFLNKNFSAEGQVKFPHARIGGDLDCTSGNFRNPKQCALNVPGVTTQGNMFLCEDFSANGLVNIMGAHVGGNLDCAGGYFYNLGNYALNAECVITGGHVYLNRHKATSDNRPFFACGRVRFANADIGRNFNCKGGQFFHSGEGSTIAAAGLRTRGAVFLSDGFVVQGNVDLKVARIGGNFVCKKCGPAKSIIDLSSTKAVAVDDDLNSWGPFEFLLDNFTYDTFFGDDAPKDKSRRDWLAKRDGPFSPMPYEQAAKVLFEMGRDNDAREILLEKEREITKHGKWKWWQKRLRWLWEKLSGYGYEPVRTFVASLIVVVAGWGIFCLADYAGRMVPHQPVVLATPEYKLEMSRATGDGDGQCRDGPKPTEAVARVFPDYPEFNALVYSLDVFIPFFALHQEPYWYPKPREADGWFVRWLLPFLYWLEIGAGWVLTSLFLLSVTGILRPRQSSGEKG